MRLFLAALLVRNVGDVMPLFARVWWLTIFCVGGVETPGAEAGTLTFMVGGEDADVAQANDILACMGKSIVHCGGPGTGGVTKLCNNLALAIEMVRFCLFDTFTHTQCVSCGV